MTLIKTILLISMSVSSCNFGKAVQEEAKKNIISHKVFMRTLSFTGAISEKIFCEKCQLNKFQIIISLKEVNPKTIMLSNQSFQPYYFFDVDNHLNISVVKELYEFAQKGLTIEKQPNSDYLIVGSQKYKLISNKQYEWLPK